MDLWTLAPLAITAIGGLVWIIRLEGRVNVSDERQQDIIKRLMRIEALIDKLVRFNGHA